MPVTDGRMDLWFRGEVGQAIVSAIEIVPDRSPQEPGPPYVNAGGRTMGDSVGRRFESDQGFAGGTRSGTTWEVEGTDDDGLFATHRAGDAITFARPAADGNYVLLLEFAEPTATAAGKRTFDVFAEGRQVLENFDIFAEAGGARRAVARALDVRVADGELNLAFRGVAGQAIVSAVVLLPADPPAAAMPYAPQCTTDAGRRALAANHLWEIGAALSQYANGHRGFLPGDYGQLQDDTGARLGIFTDPRAGTGVPRGEMSALEKAAWARSRQARDFLFPAAGKRLYLMNSDEVVAYENPARVPGGIHVLRADLRVQYLERPEAAALLGFDPAEPADPPLFPDPSDPSCRRDPLVQQSVENLYRIAAAAFDYATDRRYYFPDDLGVLHRSYEVDLSTFANPRGETPAPPDGMSEAQRVAWVNQSTDYLYVGGGRRPSFADETVLAYENPAEGEGGINVLFTDGRVEFREMRWAVETIRRDHALRK